MPYVPYSAIQQQAERDRRLREEAARRGLVEAPEIMVMGAPERDAWTLGEPTLRIPQPSVGRVQLRSEMRPTSMDQARRQLLDEAENRALRNEAIRQETVSKFPNTASAYPTTIAPFSQEMLRPIGANQSPRLVESAGPAQVPEVLPVRPQIARAPMGTDPEAAIARREARDLAVGEREDAARNEMTPPAPRVAAPARGLVEVGPMTQEQLAFAQPVPRPSRQQVEGEYFHRKPALPTGMHVAVYEDAIRRGVDPAAAVDAYEAQSLAARNIAAVGGWVGGPTESFSNADFAGEPEYLERTMRRLSDAGVVPTEVLSDRSGRLQGIRGTSREAMDAEIQREVAPEQIRGAYQAALQNAKSEEEADKIVRESVGDMISRFGSERAGSAEFANAATASLERVLAGEFTNINGGRLTNFVDAFMPLVQSGDKAAPTPTKTADGQEIPDLEFEQDVDTDMRRLVSLYNMFADRRKVPPLDSQREDFLRDLEDVVRRRRRARLPARREPMGADPMLAPAG